MTVIFAVSFWPIFAILYCIPNFYYLAVFLTFFYSFTSQFWSYWCCPWPHWNEFILAIFCLFFHNVLTLFLTWTWPWYHYLLTVFLTGVSLSWTCCICILNSCSTSKLCFIFSETEGHGCKRVVWFILPSDFNFFTQHDQCKLLILIHKYYSTNTLYIVRLNVVAKPKQYPRTSILITTLICISPPCRTMYSWPPVFTSQSWVNYFSNLFLFASKICMYITHIVSFIQQYFVLDLTVPFLTAFWPIWMYFDRISAWIWLYLLWLYFILELYLYLFLRVFVFDFALFFILYLLALFSLC